MSETIRILVADPVLTSNEQTANQFDGRPGVEVVRAPDAAKAVATLRDQIIDIALIDQRLPGLDGKAIQAWAEAEPGRLLLITTDRLASAWPAISKQVRAYDTLLKPVRRPRADTVMAAYQRLRQPTRALLVDSLVANLHAVARLLRDSRFGVAVEGIDNGLHAVRIAQLDRFDVVLTSLQLEDMPGMEVTARIAAIPNPPPIILMGGPGDRPKMNEATLEAVGAKAYLRKPFTAAALDGVLHDVFGLWRPYLTKALDVTPSQAESRVA